MSWPAGTPWPPTCALCGLETTDVRIGLVKWADPAVHGPYSSEIRCKDAVDCRRRVDLAGSRWPVDESKSPIEFVGADPA